jgi:hypothetical protein
VVITAVVVDSLDKVRPIYQFRVKTPDVVGVLFPGDTHQLQATTYIIPAVGRLLPGDVFTLRGERAVELRRNISQLEDFLEFVTELQS